MSPEEITAKLQKDHAVAVAEEKQPDPPAPEVEIVEESAPRLTRGSAALTDLEATASSQGWKPKNEFQGESADWVDAKTFLRNQELFSRIHNQNRQITRLQKTLDTMAKQHKRMTEAGYEKAKRELKSQYREALKQEDDGAAEAIDGQLEELEKRKKAHDVAAAREALAERQEQSSGNAAEFSKWVERNDWFVKHPSMRSYAEAVGMEYAKKGGATTNAEVWAHVASEVRKRFPERFEHEQGDIVDEDVRIPRKRVNTVEGADAGRRSGPKTSQRIELTQEEKDVGRMLVRRGDYPNLNAYAADLVKLGAK